MLPKGTLVRPGKPFLASVSLFGFIVCGLLLYRTHRFTVPKAHRHSTGPLVLPRMANGIALLVNLSLSSSPLPEIQMSSLHWSDQNCITVTIFNRCVYFESGGLHASHRGNANKLLRELHEFAETAPNSIFPVCFLDPLYTKLAEQIKLMGSEFDADATRSRAVRLPSTFKRVPTSFLLLRPFASAPETTTTTQQQQCPVYFPPDPPLWQSSVRWVSRDWPTWGGRDVMSFMADIYNVTLINGIWRFYGLPSGVLADILKHFYPIQHFYGGVISQDYHGIDVLHDHNYFDSSQCEVMHDETALFLSPWNQWNFFHCHDENLISSFANILTTRGPKRILYQLDHFNQSSEPVAVAAATAQRLCNKLFDILWEGNTTSFKAVRTGVHCFKHIRWGRGPRQFIGERVIPFRDAKKTPFPAATNAFSPDVEALRFHDGLGPPDWDGLTTLFQKRMLSRLNIPFRTRPCRKKDGSWKEGCSNEGHTDTWLNPIGRKALRVLYIDRGKQPRSIRNPVLLFDTFRAIGGISVQTCCHWDGPVASLIEQFHNADIIMGVHGAGLAAALYMRPGGMVVELKTYFGYAGLFPGVSSSVDHVHLQLKIDGTKEPDGLILSAETVREVAQTVVDATTWSWRMNWKPKTWKPGEQFEGCVYC